MTTNSIGPPISAITVGRNVSISWARSGDPRGGVICAAAGTVAAKHEGKQQSPEHGRILDVEIVRFSVARGAAAAITQPGDNERG